MSLNSVGLSQREIEDAFVALSPLAEEVRDRVWVAVTSSHLGTNRQRIARACRFLSLAAQDCRRFDHVMLVAAGSAIEDLARRAADLFGVTLLILHVSEQADSCSNDFPPDTPSVGQVVCTSDANGLHQDAGALQRDKAVIQIADRVDALMVRRGGRIAAELQTRLASRKDASVRVAIDGAENLQKPDSTAQQLMDLGAIGWYYPETSENNVSTKGVSQTLTDFHPAEWMQSEGQWLVHCTRTPCGPLPGQTLRQYQDEMLLAGDVDSGCEASSPFDALRRIVRSGRLVASAIASAHRWPVVCFSARPLIELIRNRRYRPHLKRWDYEPFGIALRSQAAIARGIQPVIYGEPIERKKISTDQQYRFQAIGKTYDWTREREWRSSSDVDLEQWDEADVRVFVPTVEHADRLSRRCRWQIDLVRCD